MSPGPKRLLVVDDDANLRESARDILEDAGHAVHVAGTLAEARQVLDQFGADVLLIDFNLPDGKGPELIPHAKAGHPSIQVILMTGELPAATSADASQIKAVLTKPVDPAMLLTLLAAL